MRFCCAAFACICLLVPCVAGFKRVSIDAPDSSESSSSGSWTEVHTGRSFFWEYVTYSQSDSVVVALVDNGFYGFNADLESGLWQQIKMPCREYTSDTDYCFAVSSIVAVQMPGGGTIYVALALRFNEVNKSDVDEYCIASTKSITGFIKWTMQCAVAESCRYSIRRPLVNAEGTILMPLMCDSYYENFIVAAISNDEGATWTMTPTTVSDKHLGTNELFEGYMFENKYYLSASSFNTERGFEGNPFPAMYSVDGTTWTHAGVDFPVVTMQANGTIFGLINESDVSTGLPWQIVKSTDGATWSPLNITNCPRFGLSPLPLPKFIYEEPYGFIVYGPMGAAICSSLDLVSWTPWPLPFPEPVTSTTAVNYIFKNDTNFLVFAETFLAPDYSSSGYGNGYTYLPILIGRP